MKTMALAITALAIFIVYPVATFAKDRLPSEIFAAPITVERQSPLTEIPIALHYGKLHIEASINDQPSKFLFDTGSPTVLAKEFADKLNLEVVGHNTGLDSHGNEVTMEIAVVERLTLGGTTFRDVPVLIHDFSTLSMGRCLVGNGLIGSEIFAGSVWRIDMQTALLSIAETVADLPVPKREPLRTALYDVGYPHAPIVDYTLGRLVDKAMFDTGNAANISFFNKASDHPSVQKAIIPGSRSTGEGYEGESAGGLSKIGPLSRFTIAGVTFSNGRLDQTNAIVRSSPPTLLGAGLLQNYIVTLDYPGGTMMLEARSSPDATRPDPGYSIAIDEDRAIISRLFNGSAADKAGLTLGDHILEIGGQSLTQLEGPGYCDTVHWVVEDFDPGRATDILVERDGKPYRFDLAAAE